MNIEKKRGRPPKAEGNANTERVNLGFQPALLAAIDIEAGRRGWDRNTLIRWIVREYFAQPVEWPGKGE